MNKLDKEIEQDHHTTLESLQELWEDLEGEAEDVMDSSSERQAELEADMKKITEVMQLLKDYRGIE